MRLLSLACLLGLSLTAVFGCGYGGGDYSSTFIEHVSVIFSIETAYWTISYEYDVWYNGSSTTDQNNETLTAAYFITLLESYEKGELTLVTTEPTYGYINYLYGMSWIFYGLQYTDTFYIDMVTQYTDSCGYDTFTYTGTTPAPTPPATLEDSQKEKAKKVFACYEYQGYTWESEVWNQTDSCWTQFVTTGMSQGAIDQTNTQCVQLGLYYSMYPEMLVPGCSPDMSVTCSVEQYYEVIGYIFSTEETRISFATAFYNYFYSCPGAPKEIQWSKVIKDSCIIKGGDVSIVATSGECGGMEMVEPCVEMIYQLIDQQNEQVMWFITIYMKNILNISPITSTVTLTGNVQMYTYMMEQIATSGGFISWTVYVEFFARWEAFCGTKVTVTWTEVQIWITEFFNVCCHWTLPYTTPAPTMITEVSTMVTEEVTGFSTGETAMSTGETGFTTGETGFTTGETAMSTGETGFTTGETGFTTGVPTEATCVISTPEEECAYIISYFRFIGFLYVNKTWRDSLNTKCRGHKEKHPHSSNKDKAKHFVKSTHECARDLGTCGGPDCVPPAELASTYEPVIEEGPQPPAGEDSWEFFVNFAIEVWLVGDYTILNECACAMAEYSSSFPTGDDFSHQTGDGDEPTVAPTCDEIKSNTGIFIFFQFIAVECGFQDSFFWVQFKAIFFSLDWDCGCWGEFIWTWSIDWIELIYTFLEAMCCGCTPTEMPIPTPQKSVGTWDIFRFFVSFCSNVEYRETFECFMSWYFELNGYVTFETMTFTEVYECMSIFIDYMIIVVDHPDTPKKPKGSLTITYDEFMYTCMYWVSFKGDDKMCNLFDEKYEKCKDKTLRREPREIEQPRGAIRARISEICASSSSSTWPFATECGGTSAWSEYWVSWSSGWEVASSQGTSKEQWVQEQMLCDNAIQMICEWEGPWATEEPSTVAP
ncbi:unnamed protein product, partial [Mesorhabditis belari]|uniref:Uncharacterized protein n=1 Tax=Mesorhabditis belari TaxID=2138241 RepID=A0AAF3FT02_9BILA